MADSTLNEITATKKIGDEEKECTIYTDLGTDLDDAATKFGKDVVFSNYKRSAVITAQAAMRRYLEAGKTQEEITTAMAGWKPGVQLERVVDIQKMLQNKFASMSKDEQESFISDLMSKVKAAA